MLASRFALALAVVVGTEPAALVSRLGAPRYADREAAGRALEHLGAEAVPALRAARSASDAEVRVRATDLLERIESDLLVRPTQVRLDFRDRPLEEVVAALAERGRANLVLLPGAHPRRVTLEADGPVGFWEAVARLGDVAGIELCGGTPPVVAGPGGSPISTLRLMATPPGAEPAPASVSGPFRISLLSLARHKERMFGGDALAGMMMREGLMAVEPQGRRGASSDLFRATLQILAEPRMNVALAGPIRLTEAIDELGNSLLPAAASDPTFLHQSGYNRVEAVSQSVIQADVPLNSPAQAGRLVKRLRGVAPVTISARKSDPLVILLAEAKGRTYQGAEASLTIQDVNLDAPGGAATIEVTIRLHNSPEPGFGQEFSLFRGAGHPQNQFEILDEDGKRFDQWFPSSQAYTDEGMRMTLRVPHSARNGRPAQIRFHDIARVRIDAEFEFADVEMP